MDMGKKTRGPIRRGLPKAPTGIRGLDEITEGGLAKGRPALVCGAAGSGKTLLAMEFLYRGATQYNEPGVFVSFEETQDELAANTASLGWDLKKLIRDRKLAIDYVHIDPSLIQETGEFDLEALLIRIEHAINSVKARRVVLDTVEALFGGFTNTAILRAELRRIFRWLKDRGITAIITAEPGEAALTRHGIEEYVSDCVIALDHRITDQIGTRRLRVAKYRGSHHGTNEYPFLISDTGLSILPITSLGLDYKVSTQRMSTGIARLDAMLGGKGVYRGTSLLISGTAGTGKSSVAASFVHAACGRGERCVYFSFEEAPSQIIRNMRSIGIDLAPWVEKGLLSIDSRRVTAGGLETHLAAMHRAVEDLDPAVVVVDPISNVTAVAVAEDVKNMLAKMIDYLKGRGITAMFTDLSHPGTLEMTETAISSLMDTWLLLRDIEIGGERNRDMYVLKSRGMAHSNQMREFVLTDEGIDLLDVYTGPGGVLTGTARVSQVAKEEADRLLLRQEIEQKQGQLARKRAAAEAQIAGLRDELEAQEQEFALAIQRAKQREEALATDAGRMARMRGADRMRSAAKAGRRRTPKESK